MVEGAMADTTELSEVHLLAEVSEAEVSEEVVLVAVDLEGLAAEISAAAAPVEVGKFSQYYFFTSSFYFWFFPVGLKI
jgi:hypothetical protein